MASYNGHNNCDENVASDEIIEDDILYQMDQELDQRLSYLCKLRTGQVHSTVSKNVGPSTKFRSFLQEFDVQQENCLHEACESLSTLSVGNAHTEEQSWARGDSDRSMTVRKSANASNSVRDVEAQECTQDGEEEEGSACFYESVLMPKSSSTDIRPDQLREAADESEKNVEAKAELLKNEVDENEVDDAKEEGVFDEFLDRSTRLRIGMLTKKVTALTEALKLTQEECRRLSHAKRDVSTAAQVAEKERRNMNKQVQTLQQELSKLQKSNKHCQQRVKELTGECQALRKELSSKRQSECERRSAQSSYEAQLTRSRADNAALRDQLAYLKIRHKEEVDHLRVSIASSSTRVKELERQQRNFSALVKKQEKLITILNEQKNNMAAAKAVAGLEEKFLAVISPLQPP